jgi:hypothetical protein
LACGEIVYIGGIVVGGLNWIVFPVEKINHTTINRQVPRRSTNRLWDGKAALFVATNNKGNVRRLGGEGKAWPIGNWAAHSNGFARLHSSNTPPQSTAAWLGEGGIVQGTEKRLHFVVCIFRNILWWVVFKASLNCDRAGKFDHSA